MTANEQLLTAVEKGDLPGVKAAIAAGANDFENAFIHAQMFKQRKIGQLLFKKVDSKYCNFASSRIIFAADIKKIKSLIKKAKKDNEKHNFIPIRQLNSAREGAKFFGRKDVLQLMFKEGADQYGTFINTPVYDGDIKSVKSELDKGTDFQGKRGYAYSPLIIASVMGHFEIAQLLINKGVDPGFKDSKGKTASYYAKKHENMEIYNFLKSVSSKKALKISKRYRVIKQR